MEYTVDQANSVFDLIKSVSPYAFPLLLSLILPFIWITFKKILGLGSQDNDLSDSNSSLKPKNLFRKVLSFLNLALKLKGNKAEKIVFYFSIMLFIVGGIILKVGEYNEEVIRQNTLRLKQHYLDQMIPYEEISELEKKNLSAEMIDKIVYKYPNEFIKKVENPNMLFCSDSAVIHRIHEFVFPLLESYLDFNFKYKNEIFIDNLVNDRERNKKYKDDWSFFQYIDYPIVYNFLGQSKNINKYFLNVNDSGKILIMKGDSIQ